MDRRDALLVLLAALGSAVLPAFADGASARDRLFGSRDLDRANLARLTGIYLKRHPEEERPDTLIRRLGADSWGPDPATLRRTLLAQIQEDFKAGRIENVDGWILSVTEVRLWCLYLSGDG
jgi:hypothetical protein